MNLVYIDESGHTGLNLRDTQQPVFILSGMIVPEEKWFSLENLFLTTICKYFNGTMPNSFELHAMDLKIGRGTFEGLSLPDRLALRDELLELIEENELVIIYRKIIKSKFEKFCEENYGPGIKVDPYVMALPFVSIEVDRHLRQKGENELGMLTFDEQKENLDYAERSLRTLRLDSTSILKTTNIIEKGFFIDSSKSFALQLVDLAAYYIRKYEENKLNFKVSDLDKQTFGKIKKIIPTSTGIGSSTGDILEWVKNNCLK